MGKFRFKMPEAGEGIFSIIYLLFGFISSTVMFLHSAGSKLILLYAILTIVLAAGDSFHLVPRIINAFTTEFKKYEFWAGFGLLVSSITMTIFYVVLYYIWEILYGEQVIISAAYFNILLVCVIVRILLCLLPQNNWLKREGNPKFGIIRNIPFAFVGIITVIIFAMAGNYYMAIAFAISFMCYFPVVIWAKKYPKVGMLMIPKTMAYMWIIGMGLKLM